MANGSITISQLWHSAQTAKRFRMLRGIQQVSIDDVWLLRNLQQANQDLQLRNQLAARHGIVIRRPDSLDVHKARMVRDQIIWEPCK